MRVRFPLLAPFFEINFFHKKRVKTPFFLNANLRVIGYKKLTMGIWAVWGKLKNLQIIPHMLKILCQHMISYQEVLLYYIALVLFVAVYLSVIFLMGKFTKKELTNLMFIAVIYLCYIALVVKAFFDVGFKDWNFQNTLPTANVSPFMLFTVPFYYVLPKKIKKYHLTLISLLSLGMFLAVILACIQRIVIHYRFVPHFLLDYAAHLALSLWGIYLVRSKQVELGKKDCLIGGSIIIGVALIMLMVNSVFQTAFFGLTFNDGYNINNMVLVDSPYLSAGIYLSGLSLTLLSGFFFQRIANGKRGHKEISVD